MNQTFVAAVLCLGTSVAIAADGFLPAPCEGLPDIDYLRCPTPYVELVPDRPDDIFARNFLCRETDYTLGSGRGGGCGSSGMAGWSLPPTVPVIPASDAVDLRAEIMEQVVDPCYLDMAMRNPIEGVSLEQMVELAKMVSGNSVDQMVASLLPVAAKIEDPEKRRTFYKVGKELCINAARGG